MPLTWSQLVRSIIVTPSASSSGRSIGSGKQDSEPSVTSSEKVDDRIPSRRTGAKGDPDFSPPLDTPPMEARSSETLPIVDGPWQYEPKWDGFRCLAFKAGDFVELRAKSGKPLGRYFPEIIALLRELPAAQFVTDRLEDVYEAGKRTVRNNPRSDRRRGPVRDETGPSRLRKHPAS
jgi:hypothetical protein